MSAVEVAFSISARYALSIGLFTNSLLNSLLLVTIFFKEVALSSGPDDAADDVPDDDDAAEDGELDDAFDGA